LRVAARQYARRTSWPLNCVSAWRQRWCAQSCLRLGASLARAYAHTITGRQPGAAHIITPIRAGSGAFRWRQQAFPKLIFGIRTWCACGKVFGHSGGPASWYSIAVSCRLRVASHILREALVPGSWGNFPGVCNRVAEDVVRRRIMFALHLSVPLSWFLQADKHDRDKRKACSSTAPLLAHMISKQLHERKQPSSCRRLSAIPTAR
jgi:hypothetical protein